MTPTPKAHIEEQGIGEADARGWARCARYGSKNEEEWMRREKRMRGKGEGEKEGDYGDGGGCRGESHELEFRPNDRTPDPSMTRTTERRNDRSDEHQKKR